jgi:peptidoglycan/xylan/chitin deacetylase (PgdA/CDA1 family)
MYHSVAPAGDPLTVSATQLDAQLDYLSRGGFTTVSVKEVLDAQDGHGSLPDHPIVLTFDDGFAEHYATVLPLLQKRKQKATFFIVSGWTGNDPAQRRIDPQVHRPHLVWSEVRALRDAGMEIGSHTVTHGSLVDLKHADLRVELEQSKADLERELSMPIDVFAYPFTRQHIRVRQAVQHAGYRAALVGPRGGSDRLELQRITIRGSLSLSDFRGLLGESWATGYTSGGG